MRTIPDIRDTRFSDVCIRVPKHVAIYSFTLNLDLQKHVKEVLAHCKRYQAHWIRIWTYFLRIRQSCIAFFSQCPVSQQYVIEHCVIKQRLYGLFKPRILKQALVLICICKLIHNLMCYIGITPTNNELTVKGKADIIIGVVCPCVVSQTGNHRVHKRLP